MNIYDLQLNNIKWKMYLHDGQIYQVEEMLKQGKFYEEKIMKYCLGLLDKNTIFVDLGTNMGVFTLPAAQISKKVIAIEPDIDRCKWLLDNIKLNELDNVMVYMGALGHLKGIGYMGCNMSKSVSGKMFRFSLDKKYSNSEKIVMNTLDNLLPTRDCHGLELDNLVIKIDVEGSEYLALKGMEEIIKNHPYIKIICELHPKMMKEIFNIKIDEFFKLIDNLGLKFTKIDKVLWGGHYLLERK